MYHRGGTYRKINKTELKKKKKLKKEYFNMIGYFPGKPWGWSKYFLMTKNLGGSS